MSEDITVCSVPAHVLKGLLLIASTKDIRFYLNGIYVDVPNNRLVATDGTCMLMAKEEMTKEALDAAVRPFIIPRAIIEQALKIVTRSTMPGIDIRVARRAEGRLYVTLVAIGTSFGADEIQANYPDYRRVVPKWVTGEVAYYDPLIYARVHKALCLTLDKKPETAVTRVMHNGQNGAPMFAFSQEALAVIMPMTATKLPDPDMAYRGMGFHELTDPPAPEGEQEAA